MQGSGFSFLFFQVVTVISLWALSKNKAGPVCWWNEEWAGSGWPLPPVCNSGLFLENCTARPLEDGSLFSLWCTERGHLLISRWRRSQPVPCTSNACSRYFRRRGCNALYFTRWCWGAGSKQHTYATVSCQIASEWGDFNCSSPPRAKYHSVILVVVYITLQGSF